MINLTVQGVSNLFSDIIIYAILTYSRLKSVLTDKRYVACYIQLIYLINYIVLKLSFRLSSDYFNCSSSIKFILCYHNFYCLNILRLSRSSQLVSRKVNSIRKSTHSESQLCQESQLSQKSTLSGKSTL